MVDTWALKEFLSLYFGVYVGTMVVLGPFGEEWILLPRGSKYPVFEVSGPRTAIKSMAFGTRNLKCWVLGPFG